MCVRDAGRRFLCGKSSMAIVDRDLELLAAIPFDHGASLA